MQPEIVSRELVKPTLGNHPIIHNLSFFDQITPSSLVPLLFFYTRKNGDNNHSKSSVLKASLSEALSHYYPLAGRIKDGVTFDCNDTGALFVEARMECDLYELLTSSSDELLRVLVPDNLFWKDASFTGPLVVQVTYFKCGGMSIGLCLCHKMMDMASMSSFVNDWATLARDPKQTIVSPEFTIGSMYPPLVIQNPEIRMVPPEEMKGCVSRRLVFDGSKIVELKAMVEDQVPSPTRVEVVSSLLFKSVIKAVAKASSSTSLKTSLMNHIINFRNYVSPPISKENKGNAVAMFSAYAPENKEATLGFFVEESRRSKSRFIDSCANARNMEEVLQLRNWIPDVEHEMYICTSWCRNPFYECDFGWGKPVWFATIWLKIKNKMCLIDNKEGDGIEVFISIEKEVMDLLEHDQELMSFCNLNPSVLDLDL